MSQPNRIKSQTANQTGAKPAPAPRIWLWGVAGVGIILLPLFWAVL